MILNNRVIPNRYAASSLVAVSILILNCLFFNSVFMNFLPLSGYFVIILNTLGIFYLTTIRKRAVGSIYLLLLFVSTFLSFVQAIYFSEVYYLVYPAFFLLSLFVVMLCSMKDISILVDFLSIVFFLILVLSIFAFVLVFLGVDPVYVFENRDGRPLYFFYSSFTNSYYGNLMRPSGIFDEPGAFSFYLCALCCLRVLLGKGEKLTLCILLMGFITMSLAHLVFFLFYVVYRVRLSKAISFKSFVLFFVFLYLAFYFIGGVFYEMLLSRLALGGEGLVEGDNRSLSALRAIQFIYEYPGSILVGIGPECLLGYQSCVTPMSDFNSNPLEPLMRVGLLQAWIYYSILLIFLFAPILGRRYFVVFGFGLLLLQRPYIMHVSYSVYSLSIFCIVFGVFVAQISQIIKKSHISRSELAVKWSRKLGRVHNL